MEFQSKVIEMATKIAEECQGAEDAYCVAACPMHTKAMDYVNLIAEGKNKEALLTIREALFLPGSLGRICAHPCEVQCKREQEFHQPIAIAALKRYAADQADDETLWDLSKQPATGKRAAVIGAGPAGAQAAIDLAKQGHDVTIFEKLSVVGGMMYVGIPSYRLPRNVIEFEYSYLEKLGIQLQLGVEIGKDRSFDSLQQEYNVVIVANGAHKGFQPKTPGDDASGISNAVDFLKKASLEQTTELPCRHVVVIGGGDVAMDCARTSLRLGAQKVTLIALEEFGHLPASHHEQVSATEEGIGILAGYGLQEIKQADGQVQSVVIQKCDRIFDDQGAFSPQFSGKLSTIPCDTILFATGQLVDDATDGALEQQRGGRYVVDRNTMATSLHNVFVAGDCAGSNIVVEAMALGRKAAISAHRFLSGMDLLLERDLSLEYTCDTRLNLPLPKGTQNLPRVAYNMMDPEKRKRTFEECDFGFTDEMAQQESSRCLKCQCKKCMAECIMLGDFATYPGELMEKFVSEKNLDPLCVYSCNMCDQCTLVCPEEYKFAELFGLMRKDMVKQNGGESPLAGHKAIKMHQKLGFSKVFTTKVKGAKK